MKYHDIDFLTSPGKASQRWVPQFLRRQDCWKVFSGNWRMELPERITYHSEVKVSSRENAFIIGSSSWNDLDLHVNFRMLSDSIKPPEGGVILFFLFKDIRNHYSFHCCLFKKKIELIKKYRGVWTIIGEKDYPFETCKDYAVSIQTRAGIHECAINGLKQISMYDSDIAMGCVGIGVKYCDAEFTRVSATISVNNTNEVL